MKASIRAAKSRLRSLWVISIGRLSLATAQRVAKRIARDLARSRLRQVGDDAYFHGTFVGRKALTAEQAKRRWVQRRAWGGGNKGDHGLAAVSVRRADHGGLAHSGEGVERVLYLARPYLEA